jgi:hypothetical protein
MSKQYLDGTNKPCCLATPVREHQMLWSRRPGSPPLQVELPHQHVHNLWKGAQSAATVHIMDTGEMPVRDRAFARFFRALGSAALDLAQELEAGSVGAQGWLSLEQASLGSLQRQVAEAPGMDSEAGASPRQITQHLKRGDEPNVRTALAAMQKRGVTELVTGVAPQRWRLAAPYRHSSP